MDARYSLCRLQILTLIIVRYDLDQTNKELNSTQKEIGKILKVDKKHINGFLIYRQREMQRSYLKRRRNWRKRKSNSNVMKRLLVNHWKRKSEL